MALAGFDGMERPLLEDPQPTETISAYLASHPRVTASLVLAGALAAAGLGGAAFAFVVSTVPADVFAGLGIAAGAGNFIALGMSVYHSMQTGDRQAALSWFNLSRFLGLSGIALGAAALARPHPDSTTSNPPAPSPLPVPSSSPAPALSPLPPSSSATPTATSKVTPTATSSPSRNATATAVPTPPANVTASATAVPTPSANVTASATASISATPTPSSSPAAFFKFNGTTLNNATLTAGGGSVPLIAPGDSFVASDMNHSTNGTLYFDNLAPGTQLNLTFAGKTYNVSADNPMIAFENVTVTQLAALKNPCLSWQAGAINPDPVSVRLDATYSGTALRVSQNLGTVNVAPAPAPTASSTPSPAIFAFSNLSPIKAVLRPSQISSLGGATYTSSNPADTVQSGSISFDLSGASADIRFSLTLNGVSTEVSQSNPTVPIPAGMLISDLDLALKSGSTAMQAGTGTIVGSISVTDSVTKTAQGGSLGTISALPTFQIQAVTIPGVHDQTLTWTKAAQAWLASDTIANLVIEFPRGQTSVETPPTVPAGCSVSTSPDGSTWQISFPTTDGVSMNNLFSQVSMTLFFRSQGESFELTVAKGTVDGSDISGQTLANISPIAEPTTWFSRFTATASDFARKTYQAWENGTG